MIYQLQLCYGFLDCHWRHGEILHAQDFAGEFGGAIANQIGCYWDFSDYNASLRLIVGFFMLQLFFVLTQLALNLIRDQIDAGVQVFTALLGTNYCSVSINSHFSSLLRIYPRVASYR